MMGNTSPQPYHVKRTWQGSNKNSSTACHRTQAPFSVLNGQPVPVGTLIEAFDPQGTKCGPQRSTIRSARERAPAGNIATLPAAALKDNNDDA